MNEKIYIYAHLFDFFSEFLFFLEILMFIYLLQDTSLASVQQVPVELQVTNLDQNIDAREMKRILFTIFRDHVMVGGSTELCLVG